MNMNHNRIAALERSVKNKILGGLNRFYGYPTSPPASIMARLVYEEPAPISKIRLWYMDGKLFRTIRIIFQMRSRVFYSTLKKDTLILWKSKNHMRMLACCEMHFVFIDYKKLYFYIRWLSQ